MTDCDHNNHPCLYCGRCHIEAKKQGKGSSNCKVSGFPTEHSICHIPCDNDKCEAVKEDS